MTNEKFKLTMLKLKSVTSINELKKIIEEEKIHYTVFEGKYYRNKEQTTELLTKIAEIAANFKESFEVELEDMFGHLHILEIAFTNDKPKVSTGYKWKQHLDVFQKEEPVEHEYRAIIELNNDEEIIERQSFYPIGLSECFKNNNNSERYDNATKIIFKTLEENYRKSKENQQILTKEK